MILMELYNPDDYAHMHTQNYKGRMPNLTDIGKGAWNMIKDIPDAVFSDEYRDKVANEGGPGVLDDFQRWLLGTLDTSKQGTTGPDVMPWFNQIAGWFSQNKINPGPNKNAEQPLNVNAAVDWLRNNSYDHYIKGKCGYCARYVRIALNNGGLSVPHGMRAWYAKDYLNVLPANGWDEIPVNQAGELCDVCVIGPCIDGNGNKHSSGHISMCIGNGVWASDFKQQSMIGLSGGIAPGQGNVVHVFRYRNRV